ncbi:hypothetical protein B0H11DRAFT_2010434 [Mycena galericulata]|nr:hypothetical protein B0H11DRAFT_2010434 [Mycena galericulata]
MVYKHSNPSSRSLSDDDDDETNKSREFAAEEEEEDTLVLSPAQWTRTKRLSLVPHGLFLSPMARLPPELLIHILKHLHTVRDLLAALQVCRTWCECSVELLWHKPAFPRFDTLAKMAALLDSPDQTFTYASFIRRLNFLSLGKDLKDRTFTILARCDRLERLTLVNCEHISAEALNQVLPCFANLVAIDLTGVGNTSNTAIVGLATSAQRLQGINLAGCKRVSDRGILALANNCPLLRRVKLSGLEQLTDRSVSALALSCPLLLEIDLNHCRLITDISIRDIWTHSNHMREMRLSHCPELTDAAFPAPLKTDAAGGSEPNPFPSSVSPDDLPPLVLSSSFEHLRMLDLTACSLVTDDAVDGIIAHAPRIRNLVLSKCGLLTDRSVENICKLGRYLHYLHLGHAAKITDRSVRTLARSCTRLRYIDFANCVLLTDMSLRRVGLVRVNNLTDEAIFSLADRHATLERIHLSYCDQISVMAVHFLLQKLHKLNASKVVSQLRAFLTELFDHLTEMNGTDDTEDEEDEIDAEAYREDDTPEPDPEDADDDDEFGSRRMFPSSPAQQFTFQRQPPTRTATIPPSSDPRFDALRAERSAWGVVAAAPVAGPSRAARQTPRGVADMLPIVETSRSPPPSDVASNRSARTNVSAGGFFRTYQEPAPGSPRNGALTPDLNYAEIGHRRRRRAQRRPPLIELDSSGSIPSAGSQGESTGARTAASAQTTAQTQTAASSVVWPYREPASPVSPTSRELQESVQSALGGETRGRSVRRSLRNTLSAAEHYASSLIFGRRSPPIADGGSGPSAGGSGGASH